MPYSAEPSSPSFFTKLKNKWGIDSNLQIILILLVFSLAGSTAVLLRKTWFEFLGLGVDSNFWLKTFCYLIFLFPAYQLLLLVYGFLLGQFDFFWQKELKLIRAIQGRISK